MRLKKKIIKLIIFLFIIILSNILNSNSYGAEEVSFLGTEQEIQKDETFDMKLKISDTTIASCTIWLYYDQDKIEYIKGPENSNQVNNQIIYTWVDKTGGESRKKDDVIENFEFRAKQEGAVLFGITGEFYNKEGKLINKQIQTQEILVKNPIEEISAQTEVQDSQSTKLKILRLNQEGITPVFDPDVRQYDLIVNESVNQIQVTAIPENSKAVVEISGNTNLVSGLNQIDIMVVSEDKKQTDHYQINVTKTSNKQIANVNLENLAIENVELVPAFDLLVTSYQIEISNKIEKLNILAIPEDKKASVKIIGNDQLKQGNNQITILVTAANGITTRKYIVNVYKRTEQEQMQKEAQEEQDLLESKAKIEQMSVQLIDNAKDNKQQETEKNINNLFPIIGWITLFLVIIGIGIIYFIIRKKQHKKS